MQAFYNSQVYAYLYKWINNNTCNIFTTKVCCETHTQQCIITTREVHYKEKVFPYGECFHATSKDAAHCISYTPI